MVYSEWPHIKRFWTDHCIAARHTKMPTILKHGDWKNKTHTHTKKAGYLVMQFLEMDCCARRPSHYKVQCKSASLMHFSTNRFSAILFFTGYTNFVTSWLANFTFSIFCKGLLFNKKMLCLQAEEILSFQGILFFWHPILFLYFRESNPCHFKWFTSNVILFPLKKQKWNSDFLLLQLGLASSVNLQHSEG